MSTLLGPEKGIVPDKSDWEVVALPVSQLRW